MTTNSDIWKELIEEGREACGLNDYNLAESFFTRAIFEAEKLGKHSIELDSALTNLAMFYLFITKEYDKAEKIYFQALEILIHIQGPRSREIGNYMTFLAAAQTKQGKLDEAKVFLEEHVSITAEHRGESRHSTCIPTISTAFTLNEK